MKKVNFNNKENETLTGIITLPTNQEPHNFVLFAHCFTCTKNLSAIANIARNLNQAGFGVLRFDFTGLGESEGDFADTNFSGNVDDLLEAAYFLEQNYQAPTVILGHSLGGTAAIMAAEKYDKIKAVVTIGSPSHPEHVKRLIQDEEDEILANGIARVNIGGRPFQIKKQFLDDLNAHPFKDVIRNLRKPLLIFHSPQDEIVEVKNAEEIFKAAFHPKSFVSLDGADHMISDKSISEYVGEVVASWASRYVDIPEPKILKSKSKLVASLNAEDGYTTHFYSNGHSFVADEPPDVGGKDFGPNPYDYLCAALAACTVMTVFMYARRKKWSLENATVHIDHAKEYRVDCEHCDDPKSKIDTFRKKISFKGKLDKDQIARLLEISERCPVHRTLTSEVAILTELIPETTD